MQAHGASDTLVRLSELGIIPVVRVHSQALAEKAVQALARAGFGTVEITMTVPGAADLLKDLARVGEMLLGAGTILDLREAEISIRAGARYLVSPCLVDGVPELCREAGVACIMGGLTPNEVLTAWRRGSQAVKVFPASSVGGPSYLKALKSVFPAIPLVPTGGVNLQNVGDFLRAGAACVGAGSDLVSSAMLEQGNGESVVTVGRQYLKAVAEARLGG